MTTGDRKRTALVTGASSGIGEAFARAYARSGIDLVLTARREERLSVLGRQLEGRHGVRCHVVPADLAQPDAPRAIHEAMSARGVEVDLLVNNAGYMLAGYYHERAWDRHADFIQVMVTAVAQLTHLFLPPMMGRGYGRIVNVASLAGLVPGSAGYTLYGAAKSFLIRMSESLSQELEGTGVHVTATCPGFTYSELHDVAGNRAQFSRELPGYLWMEAEPVVAETIAASERGDPVCVPGQVNKALSLAARLAPSRLVMRLMKDRSERLVPPQSSEL